MADQHSIDGSSTIDVGGDSSKSMVELNIKTLDSQIYSFQVDKNMPVSLFKEKIASEIGLPVGQQRLIFRGKVLKDDHLLSEYHVENGHTLHLVVRQPSEPQPPSSTSSGENSANNGSRGHDANAAGPRNRIGQISHSVVLGTLNAGEQGEGMVPDITRVIGAVLNSIGLGSQTATNVIGGVQPTMQFNTPAQAPQGHEAEGMQNNTGAQTQARLQAQPGQALPSQSLPQVLQMPLGAAITVPSLNAPIPDSLHTLSEFMNRMELALSQNGYQQDQSPNNRGDLPTVELPSSARGLSTSETLIVVLRHAERLLSGHAVAALSAFAGRLDQDRGSTDHTVRGQIQTESTQVGMIMQHLGALLLELGRTILTLRVGQSPAESYVNAGPAVYISPSGPNPIMVQPFPLQTNPLFSGSASSPNPGTFGPVGIGAVPRHVNIHIHTGFSLAIIVSAVGPRASNAGAQGERVNQTGSGDSGQARVLPVRNVIAAAVSSRPSVTSASQTGVSGAQPPQDSALLSPLIAEVNSRIRNLVDNMRNENQAPSGQSEISAVQNPAVRSGTGNDEGNSQLRHLADNGAGELSLSVPGVVPEREHQKAHCEHGLNPKDAPSNSSVGGFSNLSNRETTLKPVDDSESAPRSNQGNDNPEGATAVPLGLGLGGLQPKSRIRQPRSEGKSSDGTNSGASNQNQQTRASGQQVLQSLASLANRRNTNTPSSGQLPPAIGRAMECIQIEGQGADGQLDTASAMSQVLQSPALNGLLAGVSEQTGIGSPNVLRNMLEQFTQSPAMRNTVNQIVENLDSQDLGNMFSGSGGGQGGGIDLSNMFQQMMPIVSQALLGGSTIPQPMPAVGPDPRQHYNERNLNTDEKTTNQDSQIDLQQVALRIEHQNPPQEIFRSIAESAAHLYDNGNAGEDLVNELCREAGLASEYMEILGHDLRQRLEGEKGSPEKS
ncbi:LOW QUALITY PROTEIN: ubiquitin-like domain-containing protein CIP73 [Actinidia eriantha]|uniref:LOW QUALITY PROTEIN: ubiquitin-like domain-containing protein CIP73 n=1 Tax=Actinidia eriantha TaxID=165200 RepID=UPI0025901942|nr:LOW QUALITY PROTEIN: ubiquitin-like domain-containing protein CIP73 [Actinidia eriantha]